MGIRVEIGLDDAPLRRALRRAVDAGTDLRAPLLASAAILESSTRERFDTGIGPDGDAWKPSRRALETGGVTLRDKGNLLDSITSEVRESEVEVGSDGRRDSAKYAATHQFGAHITPKNGPFLVFTGADGGLVFARSVDIPARPFIGISDTDVVDLTELWTDHLRGAFDGH